MNVQMYTYIGIPTYISNSTTTYVVVVLCCFFYFFPHGGKPVGPKLEEPPHGSCHLLFHKAYDGCSKDFHRIEIRILWLF